MRKKSFPRLPTQWSTTSPTDLPSCRIDATRAPISCGPPKKEEPRRHQRYAGNQPNILAAAIGPTMGPAPAMEAKWCPKSTAGWAGQ